MSETKQLSKTKRYFVQYLSQVGGEWIDSAMCASGAEHRAVAALHIASRLGTEVDEVTSSPSWAYRIVEREVAPLTEIQKQELQQEIQQH